MFNQKLYIQKELCIKNGKILKDGECLYENTDNLSKEDFLKTVYKSEKVNYSKFFKMDFLSKMAFLSSEILLKEYEIVVPKENIGLVFSNASASLDTDKTYYDMIKDKENYFPSPAVFVYTLPNIGMGEICIKNGFKGENLFFVENEFNASLIHQNVSLLFFKKKVELVLFAWVDVQDEEYEVYMTLIGISGKTPFLVENLQKI